MLVVLACLLLVLFLMRYPLVLWRRGQFSQYTDNLTEYLLMVTAHIDAQINLTEIVVIQLVIEC